MTEADIQAAILLDLGCGDSRVFRNHVAKGFTGSEIRTNPGMVARIEPGMALLGNARRASFGLCVGSSDLIGFRKLTVTQNMVGRTLAVFSAVEVKSATGRPTDEQRAFIRVVQQAGGLAGIARSVDEARVILEITP